MERDYVAELLIHGLQQQVVERRRILYTLSTLRVKMDYDLKYYQNAITRGLKTILTDDMGDTMNLRIGYDKRKNPELHAFRPMLFSEAAMLRYGDHVWFHAADGTARQIKVNGEPKRWKTRPSDMRIPLKYGIREYGHATWIGGIHHGETLLVKIEN